MQRRNSVLILFLLPAVLFFSHCRSDKAPSTKVNGVDIPNILPEDTGSGTRAEQLTIRTNFDKAIAELKANSENPQPFLDLASVYMLESRISGNGGYYSNAVLKVLNEVLEGETSTEDQRFQAFSLKSAVLLNMHQFKDALDVANQGLAISQNNSGIWGAVVDAQVELGRYPEAVAACDRMMSLRPDLRSYSRVSYLRQIHGDNAGAIDAMKMAVESGVPGLESTEWARVQLGDLYYNTGKLDTARLLYMYSLYYRPGYPYAEMGLARADRAEQKYDSAIAHARRAIQSRTESSFISFMADLYELKGDAGKAAEIRADVKRLLLEAEESEPEDALVRHNGARELAMAFLDTKEYDKALEYAAKDYRMRPANIDAAELMAWLHFLKGDYRTAADYAGKMMATHTKGATALYKAGLIYAAAGDSARGEALKKEALDIMPYLDPRLIAAGK